MAPKDSAIHCEEQALAPSFAPVLKILAPVLKMTIITPMSQKIMKKDNRTSRGYNFIEPGRAESVFPLHNNLLLAPISVST